MAGCPTCGYDPPSAKPAKPRSLPMHRRYFAMIRFAFLNWPAQHDFRPDDEHHLRRWLQCRAGHFTRRTIETAEMSPAQAVVAIAAAMREAGPCK